MTSHSTTHIRTDIEGLRALAVGAVLVFHLGLPWLPGGFAGVDIFFVISGFLITSLLLRELGRDGRVSLGRFYARRVRRLLPAATLVLLFSAVIGWLVLPGSQHHYLAVDVAAATLYVVNWALAGRSVDYLAEDALASPLQHYWSLSVEEEYYLVWPLLILLGAMIGRRLGVDPRRPLLALIAAVAVASFAFSVVHTAQSPATAYFISTTRVWELAIGSLLAFAAPRLSRVLSPPGASAVGGLGLAMIAWSLFLFSTSTAWPGSAALVPTLGTALVIAAGCSSHSTPVGRVLGLAPLVWLGGISYALYLWHWPLLVLAEVRWPDLGLVQRLVVGALAVLLAWATKHLVEDPVRFHRRLSAVPVSLVAGALTMCLSLGAAWAVEQSLPTLDTSGKAVGARALVADRSADTWTVRRDPEAVFSASGSVVPPPAVATDDIPRIGGCQVSEGATAPREGCVYGKRGAPTSLALVGDSKMAQWFPAFDTFAKAQGWELRLYLKSACTFSTSGVAQDCADFNRAVTDRLLDDRPEHVVVSVRGSSYDHESGGFHDALAELIDGGLDPVLLADNPAPPDSGVYDCVEANPNDFAECAFDRAEAIEASGTPLLREAAQALDLRLIDLNEWICPTTQEQCPPVIAHTLLYRQGSHLTATYVKTLTPMLHRELAAVGVGERPRVGKSRR